MPTPTGMSVSEIEVKDTSQEVFLAMVEFIYSKKPNFIDADLSFLTSLYYLADKYNIGGLRDEIITSIWEHEVTKENVLDVALLAEENILHQPLSEALYAAATSFVKNAEGFKNKFENVMELFKEGNMEHSVVIFKLMERIKKNMCMNCQQSFCLDGLRVTSENFVKGARFVYVNPGLHETFLVAVYGNGKFSGSYPDGSIDYQMKFAKEYLYKCS